MLSNDDISFLYCRNRGITQRVSEDYLRSNAVNKLIVDGYLEISNEIIDNIKYYGRVSLRVTLTGKALLTQLETTDLGNSLISKIRGT